jgi:hypothetical protein
MGPATVTFICNDAEGPVENCPAPISVPGETAGHPYSASISDAAGHVTEVSGVVKVDATPPVLTLTSPADSTEVSTSFVTLTGTASDAMSGLDVVRCNDVVATVSNGNVTCDVPLRAGRNPVVLQASDVAGHSTSIGIVVWRTVVVDRLTLSPQQMTLHEGDEVPLRLVNNMGRMQTGATWEVNASAVIEVDDTNGPMLRALGPGTATVTATVGQLSAVSTVTVVGATIVLTPGTTRWLVQGTPGLALQSVIYTHQTDPDVPEAVLVEADGDSNVQLRGITDGVTTSITPASGNVPVQTMGDSFGGVLLVQTVGERTSLQRVGFIPDVTTWRWVSSGSLGKVYQTLDGTIFALERVVASGNVTSASVVVIDGSAGTLRARVPITTAVHFEHIAIDCHVPYNSIGDGIGVTDTASLSSSDTFGVVIHEGTSYSSWIGSSPDAYCGPGSHGASSGASYLLTVDTTGASTQTLLSQFSETWPSTQGNSSTPGVSALTTDASGLFWVTFSDDTTQSYGESSGGPVGRVAPGELVSYDGRHAYHDGDNIVVAGINGQPMWSAPSRGRLLAFQPDGPNVYVLDESESFVRELGPGVNVARLELSASVTDVELRYDDEWQANADGNFLTFTGPMAEHAAYEGERGSKRQQGSEPAPSCGGGLTDPRTKILGEHTHYGVGWAPTCGDFTQSLPAPSRYAFGAPRQANTWSVSNSYTWAVLKSELITNIECLLTEFGATPEIVSGYRAPRDQIRAGKGKVKKWENAYHIRGLAIDLETPNGPPTDSPPMWDDLQDIAIGGTCGQGCVEPWDWAPTHFHVDYRQVCPF